MTDQISEKIPEILSSNSALNDILNDMPNESLKNDINNSYMPNKISEQQKKEIRKLLRNEIGGKNCSIENYTTLIGSLSEKYFIDIIELTAFMSQYTIDADGKIYIFTKKIIKSKNKKIKKETENTNDTLGKIKITNKSKSKNIKRKNKDELIQNEIKDKIIKSEIIKNEIEHELIKNELIQNEIKKELIKNEMIKNEIEHDLVKQVYEKEIIENDKNNEIQEDHFNGYTYPKEIILAIPKEDSLYAPFGTQWIHDIQINDILTHENIKNQEKVEKLLQIKCPEQRKPEWFAMRNEMITASDGGCVLGVNEHEPKYKFILKKVVGSTFKGNKYCYHGKKYENIATMIYEYRLNVSINNFGLIRHPIYKFLGASPDGIVGLYKHDKKHYTKYVGRMLEIKCPMTRKIEMDGDIYDICPIYYWVQVQLQLECCDLDECDFWQCKITEYDSKNDFINDTDPNESFRSKFSGFEKGCVIQLLPKKKMKDVLDFKYWDVVYDDTIFIYPPKIEMSPCDCDIWISETISNINTNQEYSDYYIDRIFYWRLERSKCLTIDRDRKWFADNLSNFERMWKYVEFFRSNNDKQDILMNFINSMKLKINKKIMKVVDDIYTIPQKDATEDEKIKYYNKIQEILDDITQNNINKEKSAKEKECDDGKFNNTSYAF